MCRKRALAATALVALLAAGPACALPWSRGDKTQTKDAPKSSSPAPKAAVAAPQPQRASAAERTAAERMDALGRAAFWAREITNDATDVEAGIRLSAALRAMERYDEASEAVQRVLVLQPDNIDALLESARVAIARNQGFYAIDPARRVQALSPRDWRGPSLLGVALEQAERDDEALVAHRQALALAPDNPVVLSNLAMFYAGHNDMPQAERLLRQAVANPSAPIQTRQNLALVLGLQGKLAEAETLVRRDLPPAQVANNLAYIRAATGQGGTDRTWNSMR